MRALFIVVFVFLYGCESENVVETKNISLSKNLETYLKKVCEQNGFTNHKVYFTSSQKYSTQLRIELITTGKISHETKTDASLKRELAQKVFEEIDWEKQLETHSIWISLVETNGRYFFNRGRSFAWQFYVQEGHIIHGS